VSYEINVEVVPTDPAGFRDLGAHELRERFESRVDELMDTVQRIAVAAQTRLAAADGELVEAQWSARTVEMSFGINLEVESGVIIGKIKGACAFTVTLNFERRQL
jgi:hypothetical protein